MSINLAAPDYEGDLGNGLICRWSTIHDKERIGQLMGHAFREGVDKPFNTRMADQPDVVMRTDFPFMQPGDFALVQDMKRSGSLVACTCLWRHEWSFADIRFGVGRPEFVATDPDYRHRGLARALFAMIHARSAEEGHLMQAITGIPYFYRQFGYEYVLDLGGSKLLPLSQVPSKTDSEPDPYTLRLAGHDDVPHLTALYEQSRRGSLLWHEAPHAYWQHVVGYWLDPAIRTRDRLAVAMERCYQMIVDADGVVCGAVCVGTRRHAHGLSVHSFTLYPYINLLTALPPICRALRDYGAALPQVSSESHDLSELHFRLGRHHPLYDALHGRLVPAHEPYAWYIRVPDVVAFLRHVRPALERRLADSALAYYVGKLQINFYRCGVELLIDAGKVKAIEPWRAPVYGADSDLNCPALIFLQLLLGYRSLPELAAIFPDVYAKDSAVMLLNVLFPAQPSAVKALA